MAGRAWHGLCEPPGQCRELPPIARLPAGEDSKRLAKRGFPHANGVERGSTGLLLLATYSLPEFRILQPWPSLDKLQRAKPAAYGNIALKFVCHSRGSLQTETYFNSRHRLRQSSVERYHARKYLLKISRVRCHANFAAASS
jgi:hypothetical protein